MLVQLTPNECRVIGVMLEKESTTPDQYPLSLNGLTTGCNQKSNREPVLSLSEPEVQNILDDLAAKRQISELSHGSRVAKYKHRFCNTEFGSLQLSEQQRAIICVLLLRGAQTPGELRTRTNRLASFSNVDEVEACLVELQELNGETLVQKLPREPGRRESRYRHCFSEAASETVVETLASEPEGEGNISNADLLKRIEALESEMEELKKLLL